MILTPDPSKYREAYKRFNELLLDFTPDVVAKSIDEFVLNFSGAPSLRGKERTFDEHCTRMEEIGLQIKERVREHLGEWLQSILGLAQIGFLQSIAFGKPDGMTLISYKNIENQVRGYAINDLPV